MNDTQGIDLHHEASGEGPALVLLHGLYGSANNWGRYARHWADDWHVLRPDLRNHGRSPHCAHMDYAAMAADVARLLERKANGPAVILGHSMGGKVAMALALTRPEWVRGLVVADIAPVTYTSGDQGMIIEAMRRVDLTQVHSRADADRQLAAYVGTPGIRQFLLTNLTTEDEGWHWRLPLEHLATALPDIQGWPALDAQWSGDALFVHGGASPYLDEAGVRAIEQHFPHARLKTVPEAGHWLHVETPKAFTQIVEDYLGGFTKGH